MGSAGYNLVELNFILVNFKWLSSIGLGFNVFDWIGFGWFELGFVGLDWILMCLIGLGSVGFNWVLLGPIWLV